MMFEIRLSDRFWPGRRLPMILQTESAECGLACLAMIASNWGLRLDLAAMRSRFTVSVKGTTLRGLISMCASLGLQSRALKLDMAALPDLRLPCILHWGMNHFVVLRAVRRRELVIHDPAAGERRIPLREAAQHFTGVAMEVLPGPDFMPADETRRFTLLSLMGRVVGLRRGLGQLLALGLSLQVCTLLAPFYMQWIVDEALVASDRGLVTTLGIGFVILAGIQAAITGVRSWATSVLATNVSYQWLGNTFAHLMRLPLPFFEKRHLGDIVSRFGSIQAIQRALTTQFVEGVIDGLLVIVTLIVMLLYSVPLTLVASASVGVYAVIRALLFRPLKDAQARQIVHAARQQTHFFESAAGVQSVRLFSREDERRMTWMNALAEQFNSELRVASLTVSAQTANNLLFTIERVAIVWLGALAVLDAKFTVGMLFAFISYQEQFTQRLAALVDKCIEFKMLGLHGERVADIVHTPPEDTGAAAPTDIDALSASIEMRNVSFRYSDFEPYVLRDVNLTIPAGQCLAVTGASGGGKTTLVKLLLGLLEPTSGEILVGGMALRRCGLSNYRRMLGTVMQEDHLFMGSLADNISFFDAQPDPERIRACAGTAAIHDEIVAMPMGYATLVGDIGSGLSGGQKQRLLLARALYKSPRILVLDEATSHLDIWNEKLVNSAIRQARLTRIIVAHRPETIAMAQRVVLLEGGQIASDREQSPADSLSQDVPDPGFGPRVGGADKA